MGGDGADDATGATEVGHRIAALVEQQQVEEAGDGEQQGHDADERTQRGAVALPPPEQEQAGQQEHRRRQDADEADHRGEADIDPPARRTGPAEVDAEQRDDAEGQEPHPGQVGAVGAQERLRLRAAGRTPGRFPMGTAGR